MPNPVQIEPSLRITLDDGSVVLVPLNTIPQAGCDATARWLASKQKPDPAGGPALINFYADSAQSTPVDIIRNLANSILLGKVMEFATQCPSAAVQAKHDAVLVALEALEEMKRVEAGLVVIP